MNIKSKIWIEKDGEPVFSKGRCVLLKAIDEQGSISGAAREMGISYRKAWGYIKAMEERLGVDLVATRVGGGSGGGASITDEARLLVERFARLEKGMRELVDERFDEVFGRDDKKNFLTGVMQNRHITFQ